jgi:hypothetical protein
MVLGSAQSDMELKPLTHVREEEPVSDMVSVEGAQVFHMGGFAMEGVNEGGWAWRVSEV